MGLHQELLITDALKTTLLYDPEAEIYTYTSADTWLSTAQRHEHKTFWRRRESLGFLLVGYPANTVKFV